MIDFLRTVIGGLLASLLIVHAIVILAICIRPISTLPPRIRPRERARLQLPEDLR